MLYQSMWLSIIHLTKPINQTIIVDLQCNLFKGSRKIDGGWGCGEISYSGRRASTRSPSRLVCQSLIFNQGENLNHAKFENLSASEHKINYLGTMRRDTMIEILQFCLWYNNKVGLVEFGVNEAFWINQRWSNQMKLRFRSMKNKDHLCKSHM